MAVTGAVGLSPSTITMNGKTTVTVTFTNTGAAATIVTKLVPVTAPGRPLVIEHTDEPTVTVPAKVAETNGTATYKYNLLAANFNPGGGTISIGGNFTITNGTIAALTPATLTISAMSDWHPTAV